MACITIVEVHLNLSKFNNSDVLKWDVAAYYSYLPATFIDKDITLKFVNNENNAKEYGVKYWYIEDAQKNRIIKYSLGMSILYSPFFLIAHAIALILNLQSDGFSPIYEFFIEFSGLFYLIIGFYYLRKLLLNFYPEKTVAFSLLIVFFGTNLLYYSTVEAAMSHAFTFSLFSIILYYINKFYDSNSLKSIIILSVLYGLIVLVRPVNVLFIIPFIFYKIHTLMDIKQRIIFFIKNYNYVIYFIIVFIITISPQLMYYKYVTGNWIAYSYGEERFYFLSPKIYEVILSFRKGWIIYTPLMILSIFGINQLKLHTSKGFYISLIITLPLFLYVTASWWCWWYGGSFSQRALIDLYPLLIFPIASIIQNVFNYSNFFKKSIIIIISLFILLNIFQTFQYKYNIIDFDGMTKEEYLQVFGKMDSQYIDTTLLDKPDYKKAMKGIR